MKGEIKKAAWGRGWNSHHWHYFEIKADIPDTVSMCGNSPLKRIPRTGSVHDLRRGHGPMDCSACWQKLEDRNHGQSEQDHRTDDTGG